MNTWIAAIVQNLIASLLYTLILLLAGIGLASLRRRRLYRFFGITESKIFPIYLSHLRIVPKEGLNKALELIFEIKVAESF
jgi:hypothetical protein